MTKKETILDLLKGEECREEFKRPKGLAYVIATIAHIGQLRDNDTHYINHPRNCADMFNKFMTIEGWYKEDVIINNGLPCSGVVEVAYLHDVIEDTELSIDDVKDIFKEFGYLDYFNEYIDEPLKLITHDKSEDYDTYIDKVLKNPTSSLVKMFDLTDNMNLFGLSKLEDKELDRCNRYMHYFKRINDQYHFLEKLVKCRKEMADAYID